MGEFETIGTPIDGVWLQPLRILPASGGPVLHYLRPDYALFPPAAIGEIYFSEVMPGCIKAWKRHQKQSQLFAVPAGKIFIALYDARTRSPTFSSVASATLGRPGNYYLLSIPPGIWYGFTALGSQPALICNCADLPHDPAEAERLPQDSQVIPFSWAAAAKYLDIPSD